MKIERIFWYPCQACVYLSDVLLSAEIFIFPLGRKQNGKQKSQDFGGTFLFRGKKLRRVLGYTKKNLVGVVRGFQNL